MLEQRRLAVPSYIVAGMLIAIPAFDALMSVAPFRLGDPHWRFGAFGLLSNALMIPAAGVLLLLVTAVNFEHRRTLRVAGVVAWIVAILTVLGLGLFALDALQTRAAVRPEMLLSFRVATLSAAAKLVIGIVVFIAFGRAGWRAGRPTRADRSREVPLVVANPTSSSAAAGGGSDAPRPSAT